jgi:DNA-binding transcriptional LysR family regulator
MPLFEARNALIPAGRKIEWIRLQSANCHLRDKACGFRRVTLLFASTDWSNPLRPDFRSLEAFYWTAKLSSFSRAAERLNTTQPAISQRIAKLEEDIEVRLLERSARGAVLTPKGLELRDYVERLLRLMSEMMDAVAAPSAMSGVLRLGVAETLVHTWLSRFIERVHTTYPNVTLDVEVDVSSHLQTGVLEGRLDLAFLLGPVTDPSMRDFMLCGYPLAFVASPDLDFGPPNQDGIHPIEKILAQPIVTYPTTTLPYIALSQVLPRRSEFMPRIYSSSSLSTIVRMTLDKIGVSVIPPVVIEAELKRGELRLLATDIALPQLSFHATMSIKPDEALPLALVQLAKDVISESK